MNSATYKRAFKPVSSVASAEGRNNLPPGGAQPDAPSAGPMSTTSNVLNLGESAEPSAGNSNHNNQSRSFRASCGCCRPNCHYLGLDRRRRSNLAVHCPDLSPTCCWLALGAWISQLCSLGDLGPSTALELDSLEHSFADRKLSDGDESDG